MTAAIKNIHVLLIQCAMGTQVAKRRGGQTGGRHDLVGTAVAGRRFAAGALKESTFQQLVDDGDPLKPLFVFDNVTKPWLASSHMSNEVLLAMQSAILGIEDKDILNSISKDGFATGTDADYDFVRKAMRHSENF